MYSATNASNRLSSGVIAGAVIGALAGIALILAAIVLCSRKRRRQQRERRAQITHPIMRDRQRSGSSQLIFTMATELVASDNTPPPTPARPRVASFRKPVPIYVPESWESPSDRPLPHVENTMLTSASISNQESPTFPRARSPFFEDA